MNPTTGQRADAVILDETIVVPKAEILGPDGKLISVDDALAKQKIAAKTSILVHEAEQRVAEADFTLSGMNRARWRGMFAGMKTTNAHAAQKPHREKTVAKRRSKNRVAKASRKANR